MSNQKSLFEIQNLIQKSIQESHYSLELLSEVLEKPPMSIRERVSIYFDAYQIRLMESLRTDFFKIEEAIGNEAFEELLLDYISNNPSTTKNIAEYSEQFPDFIKKHRKDLYNLAVIDWLEVLSNRTAKPISSLSFEQVGQSIPFRIQILPSTIFKQEDDLRIVVYQKDEEAYQLEINAVEFELLQFLEEEKSMDEVVLFINKINLKYEQASEVIFNWIKNNVIYCKSI